MSGPDRHPDGPRALDTVTALAGGLPLWGAFDCAHDERMSFWIRTGDVPWACLYAGEIAAELVEVAPHLVRIRKGNAGSQRLVDHGWSRNWGVYLACDAPLADLRRHLRRYLRIATEDGRKFLFRFYDPRVLRLYLPTCNRRELEAFFGPVSAIFIELPDATGFEILRREAGELVVERAPLRPATSDIRLSPPRP